MMIVFHVRARRNPHATSIEDASRRAGMEQRAKRPVFGRFRAILEGLRVSDKKIYVPGSRGSKQGLFRAIYPRKGIGAESEKLKISKI